MEEKWWSKFQNRTNEGKEDSKEKVSTNDTYNEAVNYIDDLNTKIDGSLKFEDKEPTVAEEHVESFVKDVKSGINEFVSAQEVSKNADDAIELLHPTPAKKEPAVKVKDDNPIVEDFDYVKDAVNDVLNKREVRDAVDSVKAGANGVADKAKEVWNSDTVQNTYGYVKDKVDEQLAREEVQNVINYAKDKAEEAKDWAFEVYNRDDVQEGVEKVKATASNAYNGVKEGFNSFINDEKVQDGYTAVKDATVKTTNKVVNHVTTTFDEVRNSENLKEEFDEWKYSALEFTKHSGRVVAATAVEIKNNEHVQEFGRYLKESAQKALAAAGSWINRRLGGVEYYDHRDDDKEEK